MTAFPTHRRASYFPTAVWFKIQAVVSTNPSIPLSLTFYLALIGSDFMV